MRQGMIGWMKAWANHVRSSDAGAPDEKKSGGSAGRAALTTELHAQVAGILAGMVWSVFQERME